MRTCTFKLSTPADRPTKLLVPGYIGRRPVILWTLSGQALRRHHHVCVSITTEVPPPHHMFINPEVPGTIELALRWFFGWQETLHKH